MWNRIGRTTKAATLLLVAASFVTATSPVNAVSGGASSQPQSGESSTVGSAGYANAFVSHARAWVTAPESDSSGDGGGNASSPTSAAAPASVSDASQSDGPAPTVVVTPSASSSAPALKVKTAEPLEMPDIADTEVVPATAESQIQQITLPPGVTLPPGITLPPLLNLPPVQGLEVKAALLLLLTQIKASALATLPAAELATLAAIDRARAEAVEAFAEVDMPEQEALVLANIDAARAKAVQAFAQATTAVIAKFDQAILAVTNADPAKWNNTPGDAITMINWARTTIQQKLLEAQQQLAAVAAQFVV